MIKKAYIKTFGCQQNVRDSEMAAGLLAAEGYALTGVLRDADVIFINTCAIRAHAENKALSYIGRLRALKRDKPSLRVIVCGCMAAQPAVAAKLKAEYPQVDIIIGPDALPKLPALLRHSQNDGVRVTDIGEDYTWHEPMPAARELQVSSYKLQENVDAEGGATDHPGAARHPSTEGNVGGDDLGAARSATDHPGAARHPSTEGNVGGDDLGAPQFGIPREALVTVMRGCDNYCSYCIVPYVRGRERSRSAEAVLQEIRQAVAGGYTSVMLLGQNVNAYRDGNTDFPALLRKINALNSAFTIKFMTSHPKDAGLPLFQAIAECEKVEKHLHLPVQSGSSAVLAAMNRKYTREQYLDKVDALRGLVPDIRLTSDIIVGFPGESDADFEDTLSLVERVRFGQLFTFLFSPRKGTPAAQMADVVPDGVKKERFMRLLEVQKRVEAQQ